MNKPPDPRKMEQILAAVDTTLRRSFPEDYDKRCMYAAFAIRALLAADNHVSIVIAGQFLAAVVSKDLARLSYQGYGGAEHSVSHYWIETPDRLVDLGPYYLPKNSRFPAASLPALAWLKSDKLPAAFRYVGHKHYDGNTVIVNNEIAERLRSFTESALIQYRNQLDTIQFPGWIMTGQHAFEKKQKQRDPWALAAATLKS